MFLYAKEREARIAAEKGREADRQRFEEQLQEERRRSEAHREEERRRYEEERRHSEAQREEERRSSEAHREDERRRSAETHQAMLTAISALTDKITELAGPNRDNGR